MLLPRGGVVARWCGAKALLGGCGVVGFGGRLPVCWFGIWEETTCALRELLHPRTAPLAYHQLHHLRMLSCLATLTHAQVNVIPWNPVDESEFQRPSRNRVFAFTRAVEAAGLPCTVRETRGLEAAAACGQLRNQFQKTPLPQFEKPL